ncbi:hypothetical protein [Shewanella cyperi]|nr:hypothetical protein [Shewanella cyperi]
MELDERESSRGQWAIACILVTLYYGAIINGGYYIIYGETLWA